ncbi:MAG: adenylate kinase family protein [Endomicrobiales bacterium]
MREEKNAILLLGAPGSGKTAVAERLAFHRRMAVIKAGRLLRTEAELNTPLGRQVAPYLEAGKLVPSPCVTEAVAAKIERTDAVTLLFDGYPRRKDQIPLFFALGAREGFRLEAAIVLAVPRLLAVKRLSGRRVCPNDGTVYNIHFDPPKRQGICDLCGWHLEQRRDDRPDVVARRMSAYEKFTVPVVKYFKTYYPYLTIEEQTTKPMDEIIASLLTFLSRRERPAGRGAAGRRRGKAFTT